MNTRRDVPRLVDMPEELAADFKAQRRSWVLLDLLDGQGEDAIYRRQIDIAIEAARLEGCDESEVEVIAAQARRDIADALADFRGPREAADWRADFAAAMAVIEQARAHDERGGQSL